MLNELKYILGDSLYYLSIQDFYKKWELKHVDEEKFIESVEEVSGKELDWFFDAWLHDTRVMDYSIQKWHSEKNDDGTYKVFLNIKNLGNRHMPLLVEIEFSEQNHYKFHKTINISEVKPICRPLLSRVSKDESFLYTCLHHNLTEAKE